MKSLSLTFFAIAALTLLWTTRSDSDEPGKAPAPAVDPTRDKKPGSGAPQGANQETPPAADSEKDTALKALHAEHLKHMRARATAVKVQIAGAESDADMIPEPLMKFNNRSLRNIDATLWGWTSRGHLVGVFAAVRLVNFRPDEGPWLYCFSSLSPERVAAEFAGDHQFSAEKAGIEWKVIPGGPAPGTSTAERMRQMKEMSARFSATTIDYAARTEELRLLPRPLYRNEQPEGAPEVGDVVDGALFALTIEGTVPIAMVLFELRQTDQGTSAWHFAVGSNTWAGLSVRLDEKEVWTKQVVTRAGKYDWWTTFFER